MRIIVASCICLAVQVVAGGDVSAQAPRTLQGPETAFKVDEVRKLALPDVAGDYVVSGNQTFDGWFLKAERIVFKAGSKLVFTRTALQNRRQFFIIARELVVEDPGSPGTITWERGAAPSAAGNAGQAPTGAHANAEGAVGGRGADGAAGFEGVAGESAPSLTLVVKAVPGSGPVIDFSGQAGGTGGQGQRGGSGGVGGWGNPASQNAFNCNRGAGGGATGGNGGNGGTGGPGGRGGYGGAVTVISSAANLQALSQRFRLNVAAGEGGSGGVGGPGGDGGPGGRGGQESLPWCRGNGSQGPSGGPGGTGPGGPTGPRGTNGDFLVGGVSAADFEITFKGRAD